MPAATPQFLDDAAVDVDQWIADEVNAAFAEQEGTAFVTGNGTNKPKGFLADDHGGRGELEPGASSATSRPARPARLPASNPSDVLVDLVYALKAGYRQNASWVMNRKTQAAMRKLKDDDGNYLWQPPATADGTRDADGLPAGRGRGHAGHRRQFADAIAFGDFKRGYLIVDRQGVNVLRDPYTAKPYVLFYTTKRVGGGVQNFDAIKLLKFAVS